MRIPRMEQVAPFVYEFFAIFSDYSLLEAKMVVIPKVTLDGIEAAVHVHGVYFEGATRKDEHLEPSSQNAAGTAA